MDRHGVYGLQRNLLVENIIDIYKQECSRSAQGHRAPGAGGSPGTARFRATLFLGQEWRPWPPTLALQLTQGMRRGLGCPLGGH